MSWFDATGFANLAKSALKEAQKTIDKALDIKEEEVGAQSTDIKQSSGHATEDNFFSEWGVDKTDTMSKTTVSAPVTPPSTMTKKLPTSSSLWGSFTGSFFENPIAQEESKSTKSEHDSPTRPTNFISNQPKKSLSFRSLSLDLPQESSSKPDVTLDKPCEKEESSSDCEGVDNETPDDGTNIRQEIMNFPSVEVVLRKKEPRNFNNRLSAISSESDRRSSESCEVIGTTPDSELTTSMSASSSVARLRQSGSFESVEVLTSPSSVEIISSDQYKDRYSSESISPVAEGDYAEGIPELVEDEDEEVSVAEDSYTSASESTQTLTAATVMEFYHTDTVKDLMLKSTSSLDTSFTESPRDTNPIIRSNVNLPLTHTSSSQIVLTPVTCEPPPHEQIKSSDTMASSSKSVETHSDISKSDLTDSNVRSFEMESGIIKMTDNESLLCDSECEAQGMSSCEEGTLMGSSGEETTLHAAITSSSDLKNMLEDAMTEQSPPPREHSPISSESRSDLVKVGSSGHTSGDELETTTSSDIEIISSPTPNGDSSSATSRQSPAKLLYRSNKGKMTLVVGSDIAIPDLGRVLCKVKGHQREPSETSSGGSDDSSEVDKLFKKISEMTEILDMREAKLIDLSRKNVELQEKNSNLTDQLESQKQTQDVNHMSEEFTQRLAALERKFQQAIREKEVMRKQLEQAKAVVAASEEEAEKDEIIAELRTEGEKLSKQQLALNNVIKKLRTTEKENQKSISSLKEQIEECNQEVERSKKALFAKEEVERLQIEAVHQLTRSNQRLESQASNLQSQVDNLTSTIVSLQRELSEKKENSGKLEEELKNLTASIEVDVRKRLEAEWEVVAEQRDTLENAIAELREQLTLAEEQHSKKESKLRMENADLLRRLESVEMRAEELSQSVTMATKPLVRQIDTLTASNNTAILVWEKEERKYNQTISELKSTISSLTEKERNSREQLVSIMSRNSSIESKMATMQQELDDMKLEVMNWTEKYKQLLQDKEKLEEDHENQIKSINKKLDEVKRELSSYEHQLAVERAALDAEKRKNATMQEQLRQSRGVTPPSGSPRSSPTLSFGRASVTESLSSSAWPNFGDDLFETSSNAGRMSSVYDSLRPGNTTGLLEGLQSQLKMRDGEVHQLQWELSKRELERATLSNEVSELTTKVETQEKQLSALSTLQTQYDALLQMYGEKLEESQELRMDLQDIKDMYKTQIDQLLKKEPSINS